jgi:hypothetical protein
MLIVARYQRQLGLRPPCRPSTKALGPRVPPHLHLAGTSAPARAAPCSRRSE